MKSGPEKRLSFPARRRVIRPPVGYQDTVEQLLATWAGKGKALKVMNRTPAEIRTLLRDARKLAAKEAALRAEYEAKLGPLADDRLVAAGEVWRAVLDVYAAVRGATNAPELQKEFAFLGKTFTRYKTKTGKPRPA